MKMFLTTLIFICLALGIYSQNMTVSFQPKVAGLKIDSIRVSNLNKKESIKIAESELLILGSTTGGDYFNHFSENGSIFPNPCGGNSVLYFYMPADQEAEIMVCNISGQVLANKKDKFAAGNHRFKIDVPSGGLYTVITRTSGWSGSFKLLSTGLNSQESRISHLGFEPGLNAKSLVVSGKSIKYSMGDVLLCTAFSGKNSTIIADSPAATSIYQVEFYGCTDADNHDYPVVKINSLWWMAKNLQTTKYSDGTAVPDVTVNTAWKALTTGAYCWYNNEIANKEKYGALYNWFAVGTGKLCPVGWHVSTYDEWNGLLSFLGGQVSTGGKLKETGSATWSALNTGATNGSGFSAPGGGYRDSSNGNFANLNNYGYYWSSVEGDSTHGRDFHLEGDNNRIYPGQSYKEGGFSVRCVRN